MIESGLQTRSNANFFNTIRHDQPPQKLNGTSRTPARNKHGFIPRLARPERTFTGRSIDRLAVHP
jgi:hypothetical protein